MDRLSVAEYAALFESASREECERLLRETRTDTRTGVRLLREKAARRLERIAAEHARMRSLMSVQDALHAEGHSVVAGVDEVGRGALAGPVTAAAVVLPSDARIEGLDDSKRLTSTARKRVAAAIERSASAIGIAHLPAHVIDAVGIAQATRKAMELSIARLPHTPDHVVIDGLPVDLPYPETAVVRGDSLVACVAAASIIAKVARDHLMSELALSYTGYGLQANKGYGTADHIASIDRHGTSPIHRRSFAPCADEMTLF